MFMGGLGGLGGLGSSCLIGRLGGSLGGSMALFEGSSLSGNSRTINSVCTTIASTLHTCIK